MKEGVKVFIDYQIEKIDPLTHVHNWEEINEIPNKDGEYMNPPGKVCRKCGTLKLNKDKK
jgi:hypothetical protein